MARVQGLLTRLVAVQVSRSGVCWTVLPMRVLLRHELHVSGVKITVPCICTGSESWCALITPVACTTLQGCTRSRGPTSMHVTATQGLQGLYNALQSAS
jgi:hypothetical protein